MSVTSKRTTAIIFISMSALLIASFYFLFDFYVKKSASDFLVNWLKAEEISIAEGNLLTSTAKNQAVLMSSDLIKGMSLVDLSSTIRSVQIHSGADFDTSPIKKYADPGQALVENVGLFEKIAYATIPGHQDMAIFFYVFSEKIRQFYFLTCGLIIALVAFSMGMILKIQRIEFMHRQKTVAEYASRAARVAHEIRGPLGMIESIGEMNKNTNPEIAEQISIALKRVDEVTADFIDGRKAIAKIKNLKIPESKSAFHEFDLNSVINDAISAKKIQYPSLSVEVTDCTHSTPHIFAISKADIQQVISGLVDNSVDAKATKILIEIDIVANKFICKIVDNGEGMSPDVLSNIGKKGFTFGKPHGSGLGAYYTQSTIASGGGTISYHSEPGRGTTAQISIPFHISFASEQPKFNVGSKELLVLDDNAHVHATWKIVLRAYPNLKVHYFFDPKAIKNFVGQNGDRFALVTDFDLRADQDGLEVATEMGLSNNALLLTGHEYDQDVRLKALIAGVPILGKKRLSEIKFITASAGA